MEADGLVEKKRKSLVRPGALPPVTVLDITIRDVDGELIGRPAEWLDDDGVAPAVLIKQSTVGKDKGKTPVGGLGDRVLAKIFPAKDRGGPAYTARIIKVLDEAPATPSLGVFRATPGGGGRLMPIEKRGEEILVDAGLRRRRPRTAIWSKSNSTRLGRYGLPRAQVQNVIGSVASEKAISMIAIHAHGIPARLSRNGVV